MALRKEKSLKSQLLSAMAAKAFIMHFCSHAFFTELLSFRAFEVVMQQLSDGSGSPMAFTNSSETR
jgi:hypothetical protein